MEGALAAMFNTITDIAKVEIDPSLTREMEIEGEEVGAGSTRGLDSRHLAFMPRSFSCFGGPRRKD